MNIGEKLYNVFWDGAAKHFGEQPESIIKHKGYIELHLCQNGCSNVSITAPPDSGKTTLLAYVVIRTAFRKPGTKILVISTSDRQSRRIVDKCISLMRSAGLDSMLMKENDKEIRIISHNPTVPMVQVHFLTNRSDELSTWIMVNASNAAVETQKQYYRVFADDVLCLGNIRKYLDTSKLITVADSYDDPQTWTFGLAQDNLNLSELIDIGNYVGTIVRHNMGAQAKKDFWKLPEEGGEEEMPY